MKRINNVLIENFECFMKNEEKAETTCEKYLRDVKTFSKWIGGNGVDKNMVMKYKAFLISRYKPSSVNSILSALNSFFCCNEWYDCRVKFLKIQKQLFISMEKQLTKQEYFELLKEAKKHNERLYLVMETICSTGIRVSELEFVTLESIESGIVSINCKGKLRKVFLPAVLIEKLKVYALNNNIKSGSVFVTRTGKPLDRTNIWHDMKRICVYAGVSKEKVYPHNLRHLFARTYYSQQKDVVRLADILGHSNINTTRIYTAETGEEYKKQIESLDLVLN